MKSRVSNYNDRGGQVEGWQITYSSLSLILVVVFVMLVSFSVADRRKMSDLQGAVKREAGDRDSKEKKEKNVGAAAVEGNNDGLWINDAVNSLKKSLTLSGMENDVTVQRHSKGIRLKFASDVVFQSGSAVVNEKVYFYLDEISRIADVRNLSLRVEGHTDDIPVTTEEFPSNWELSTKRAVNIVRYFIEKKGFPAGRLSAEGFGQYRPLVTGDGPEERKQNRRIEIYADKQEGNGVFSGDGGHDEKGQ